MCIRAVVCFTYKFYVTNKMIFLKHCFEHVVPYLNTCKIKSSSLCLTFKGHLNKNDPFPPQHFYSYCSLLSTFFFILILQRLLNSLSYTNFYLKDTLFLYRVINTHLFYIYIYVCVCVRVCIYIYTHIYVYIVHTHIYVLNE